MDSAISPGDERFKLNLGTYLKSRVRLDVGRAGRCRLEKVLGFDRDLTTGYVEVAWRFTPRAQREALGHQTFRR